MSRCVWAQNKGLAERAHQIKETDHPQGFELANQSPSEVQKYCCLTLQREGIFP